MSTKITYGKAYKFNLETTAENPFKDREMQEMTKDSQEYWFADASMLGPYGDRIRRAGWEIQILGLRRFVVATEHGGLREVLSPNKTLVRKANTGTGLGRIRYIVEVK